MFKKINKNNKNIIVSPRSSIHGKNLKGTKSVVRRSIDNFVVTSRLTHHIYTLVQTIILIFTLHVLNMADGDDGGKGINFLFLALAGTICAAIAISLYRCAASGCPGRRRPPAAIAGARADITYDSSLQHSSVQLIPAYTYTKGIGVGVGDDKTCAVCLCEFKEGEELRALPECLHSFHVPCIDMWLFSHTNCPLCRADATPVPSPGAGCRRSTSDTSLAGQHI